MELTGTYPCSHLNPLTKAQLSFASPIHVNFQAGPRLPDLLFPIGQHPRLFVVILLNLHAVLNFRHVEARRIIFHHAPHAEPGCTSTNGFLHDGNPAVRNAVRPTIIVGGNNFLFEQAVQRKTIRLCLHVRVVIFSLFPDSPAILAVVALGPPAIEDAAIWLSIQRSLLTTGSTGLVRADRVVKPEIRAGDQVASHTDIIIFQEDDFAAKCITARDTIHLLDQSLPRLVSRMCLAGKNDLYRPLWIVQNSTYTFNVAENERCPFVGCVAPGKANNESISIQHALEFSHLHRAFTQAQVLLSQTPARVVNESLFPLHMRLPEFFIGNVYNALP